MPYIGRELERGTYLKLDDISSSFDGNKTIFNLTKGGDPFFPGSPQSIIVSVNGTILEPVTEYGKAKVKLFHKLNKLKNKLVHLNYNA